jgi:16S rRNA (uracil1498-N3)-methyltransferase
MRIVTQFYILPESVEGDLLTLAGEEVRHAVKVLRHKKGDMILASDGRGRSFEAEVVSVSSSQLKARIVKTETGKNESKVEVSLSVGLTKGEKLDWLVEKATEIGATAIYPFFARFSEVKWGREQIAKNEARWNRLALAAFKQSGRSVIPQVEVLGNFAEVIDRGKEGELLTAHPAPGAKPVAGSLGEGRKVMGVIGPEGGFSPEETETLQKAGSKLVSLGPRRLRAETAGLVLLSQILTVKAEL